MPMSYKIVRWYESGESEIVERGLTLRAAKAHCQNPETSSRTCTLPENIERTERLGPWFDGYSDDTD